MNNTVTVIGAGLAGSEAAWQLAQRGIQVNLIEMRPVKSGPAHHTENFAELVCSNSLRGDRLENAVGLLKEELRRLDSIIMQCAEATRVEAGGALAVDRHGFAAMVTEESVTPCASSDSFSSREAIPMWQVPSMVSEMPVRLLNWRLVQTIPPSASRTTTAGKGHSPLPTDSSVFSLAVK